MNKLEQLKQHTIVVADTGDFEAVEQYRPQDSTTNPSLIYTAAQMPAYKEFCQKIIKDASGQNIEDILDELIVSFGCELTKRVKGYVSTEVDAALSFDTQATVEKAQKLMKLYRQKGVDSSRILIKIASTWEGIQAARVLEEQGIKCNLTLLFSLVQAAACAKAKAFLISPFVGRILDWYKKNGLYKERDVDPGVTSVQNIYRYYKQFSYDTVIMGASFRSLEEIEQLCGLDRLTIAPKFLEILQSDNKGLSNQMNQLSTDLFESELDVSEKSFRFLLNEDAMATEKLSEGIRLFHQDTQKLRQLIASYL
ncbi:MAG: transaldolase [Alphaproteobacteria bacterium]